MSKPSITPWTENCFSKLPCVTDMQRINNLFKEYQSKHPYAEHFFLMDDEHSNKKIIGTSIDIDQVP